MFTHSGVWFYKGILQGFMGSIMFHMHCCRLLPRNLLINVSSFLVTSEHILFYITIPSWFIILYYFSFLFLQPSDSMVYCAFFALSISSLVFQYSFFLLNYKVQFVFWNILFCILSTRSDQSCMSAFSVQVHAINATWHCHHFMSASISSDPSLNFFSYCPTSKEIKWIFLLNLVDH